MSLPRYQVNFVTASLVFSRVSIFCPGPRWRLLSPDPLVCPLSKFLATSLNLFNDSSSSGSNIYAGVQVSIQIEPYTFVFPYSTSSL